MRPSSTSSLKCERGMDTRTLASDAMSLVTLGPGTSTRYSWTSPRPRSSSSKTSLSWASAGTYPWKSVMAFSIRALVSGDDMRRRSDPVALEELLADDHALDLRRALADEQQR